MRRRRRLLVLVIVLVSLAACGGDDDDGESASPTVRVIPTVSDTATAGAASPSAASPAASPVAEGWELVARFGARSALHAPTDVAIATDGALWVFDAARGEVVRVVDGAATLRVPAGSHTRSVAAGPHGTVFAKSVEGTTLVELDADGTNVGQIDLQQQMVSMAFDMADLVVDPVGRVYAASGWPRGADGSPRPYGGIRVFDADGVVLESIPAPAGYQPQALALAPDGRLYAGYHALDRPDTLLRLDIRAFDPLDMESVTLPLPDGLRVDGLAVDGNGRIIVVTLEVPNDLAAGPTRVTILDAAGEVEAEWEAVGHGGGFLERAAGIALDAKGRILLADGLGHRVLLYEQDGTPAGSIGDVQPGELVRASGMAVDPEGNLLVADPSARRVLAFNPNGEVVGEWPVDVLSGDPSEPMDLAVDAQGTIYATLNAPSRIAVIPTNGGAEGEWAPPVRTAESGRPLIFRPSSVAVDANGRLHVAMRQESELDIQAYTPAGEPVETWKLPDDTHSVFAVAAAGEHVVALVAREGDLGNARSIDLMRLRPDWSVDLVASYPFPTQDRPGLLPTDIAVAPNGSIALCDPLSRRVVVLDSTGAEIASWTVEGGDGQPVSDLTVAAGADGRVYVADGQAAEVLVYAPAS